MEALLEDTIPPINLHPKSLPMIGSKKKLCYKKNSCFEISYNQQRNYPDTYGQCLYIHIFFNFNHYVLRLN